MEKPAQPNHWNEEEVEEEGEKEGTGEEEGGEEGEDFQTQVRNWKSNQY